MQVGVYIDGFNLYYGARGLCGRAAVEHPAGGG